MNLSTLLFFLALAIFESSACLWSGLMESMQVEEDPKVHLERSLRIKQALVGCEPLVADQYDLSQRQGKTMLETVRHCNQDFKNGWIFCSMMGMWCDGQRNTPAGQVNPIGIMVDAFFIMPQEPQPPMEQPPTPEPEPAANSIGPGYYTEMIRSYINKVAIGDVATESSHFEPVAPPSKEILEEFRKIPDALKVCRPAIEELDKKDSLKVLDACIEDFDSNFSECSCYGMWCQVKLNLNNGGNPMSALLDVAYWKHHTQKSNFKY